MPIRWFAAASLVAAVALAAAQEPPAPREELVDRVKRAIDDGIRYLRHAQREDGGWETDVVGQIAQPGGWTALVTLAVLTAGVPADDPMAARALDWLRKLPPRHVYTTALQTMALAEAGSPRDLPKIQANVDWLLKARVYGGGKLTGWAYTEHRGTPDGSNSQYAMLGLHAGRNAGAAIDDAAWREIRDYYVASQDEDGGWRYHAEQSRMATIQTMTNAGLSGLFIAGEELSKGRQRLDERTGVAADCGKYDENRPVAAALRWLEGGEGVGRPHFSLEPPTNVFYNIYGIERVGRLSGQRFLAGRDWYREGCELLVAKQRNDDSPESGSWAISGRGTDGWPAISTSFALLFLSKGRTPILISKLAYGRGDEWNNKHADAKHLAEYASRELFRRKPMAWQVWDARRLDVRGKDARSREVAELLQAPIVYMNGHKAPKLTDTQKQILKQYLEEGGFLLAEACCGSEEFADGFRRLMNDPIDGLFPDAPLRPLPAGHPVWSAHAVVSPDLFTEGRVPEGIEVGCKTVVVFVPQPVAGYWEENLSKSGRGEAAFRFAGNVVAYATGLEPPQPRLKVRQLAPDAENERKTPRGFLKVAQLMHDGDPRPAPRAMRNLMQHLRETTGLEAALRTEEVPLTDPGVFQYKFLYMHGRKAFTSDERQLTGLRANLETGGLLFSNSCCGREAFDRSFREFAKKLFPGKPLVPIPPDDELFGRDIGGKDIREVLCRRERPGSDGPDTEYRRYAPALEGIKINDRWAVVYSKYDIGCALEGHKSSDCKGYHPDSARDIAAAVALYALKR